MSNRRLYKGKDNHLTPWMCGAVLLHILVFSLVLPKLQKPELHNDGIPLLVSMVKLQNQMVTQTLQPEINQSLEQPKQTLKRNRAVNESSIKLEQSVMTTKSSTTEVMPDVEKSRTESLNPIEHIQVATQETSTEKHAETKADYAESVEEKIEPPKFGVAYLNNPAPDYPSLSRRKGDEGRVLLKVLVSADGKAEDVQIEKSSGFELLDEAAQKTVKQWRFVPARKGGEVLSAYVIVPIKFSLKG